jgi:hypothetical protein
MLLYVHHLSYFTIRFGIILLSLLSGTRNFARVFICMDLLRLIFMISIADLSAARPQEPKFMLYTLKIIGEKWVFFSFALL